MSKNPYIELVVASLITEVSKLVVKAMTTKQGVNMCKNYCWVGVIRLIGGSLAPQRYHTINQHGQDM